MNEVQERFQNNHHECHQFHILASMTLFMRESLGLSFKIIFSLVHTVLVNSGMKFLMFIVLEAENQWLKRKKLMQMCIGTDAAAEVKILKNMKLQQKSSLGSFCPGSYDVMLSCD